MQSKGSRASRYSDKCRGNSDQIDPSPAESSKSAAILISKLSLTEQKDLLGRLNRRFANWQMAMDINDKIRHYFRSWADKS